MSEERPPDHAGTAPTHFDAFAQAQSLAAAVGSQVTAFLANPTNALTLRTIKETTGSGKPLLGPDPAVPTRSQVYGVPLLDPPTCRSGRCGPCPPAGS